MFEQAFKNIDDVLWKDAGCTSELDYTEQTSWLLFLKYLDDLEQDRVAEAALNGKKYTYILDKPYRWETWAAPKGKDDKLDHNATLTGDDLRDFVNQKLFPYLHDFKQKATGPNTIEYKIGQIFGEIKNKISSGYNLREIIDHIDELRFRSQNEKHELSHLYEAKIKNMGNAGRNGGEYYTPRPLIRAIVHVVKPKIGERIYDGAVGSAGFLCEAFEYLKTQGKLTTKDLTKLQTSTFYGKEKKSLAYVIAIMNMILHGIDAPNIIHTNTLTENLADIQEKDRYDVVLANPPFGGKERKEVQQNFPIRTGETAFLFLQHFIKILKAGGRGGVVIKNTFLSNTDNASVSLRKLLLESCNLHTVLDLPGGTFQGAGVKTVVLFFEKGAPTRKVWFYQLDPGRNMGKTNPLNDVDLAEFVKLQKSFADSPKSWSVDAKTIDQSTFDLSVKNPNGGKEIIHREPQEIMDEIAKLDAESAKVLENIKALL
ncbi:MAG: type I restriction endonuclease subunit M [Deltaproteobacteria bacterium CG11_big_fil_rev_8_21_14_0_20_49_13]|nr:MAG: type I restriction endonuclease subunit M [Deltaproteobacteria bacterium CG11_big_fil_rev_8_21_14_0_20_49_13]